MATSFLQPHKAVTLDQINTPLARMLNQHYRDQCAPFTLAYDNAVELGARKTDLLMRQSRIGTCVWMITERLNNNCAMRVLNYQAAVADLGASPATATPEAIEAYKEAEGRLQFCARYPHKVNRHAVNPHPVQSYFKPRSTPYEPTGEADKKQ